MHQITDSLEPKNLNEIKTWGKDPIYNAESNILSDFDKIMKIHEMITESKTDNFSSDLIQLKESMGQKYPNIEISLEAVSTCTVTQEVVSSSENKELQKRTVINK